MEFLADNVKAEPVVLLLTARSGSGDDRALIDRLAERGAVQLIELAPLRDSEVTGVVTACLGPGADQRLLELIRSRAEGIPLLIEELLGAVGDDPSLMVIPASVAELTRARLDALPTAARLCVRAAAVLGERFEWTLLPDTTGLADDTVLDGLRAAIDADLVGVDSAGGGFVFRHALTRDAVLDALLPPERSALARRGLDLVEATHPGLDGPWCGLAASLAALAGDSSRAAELLVEMGRRDLQKGALGTAATELERAMAIKGDPLFTADAAEVLAEVLVLAGNPRRAGEVTDTLMTALAQLDAAPARLAGAHLRMARAWTVAGQWDTAVEQLRQSTTSAGASPTHRPQVDLVGALVSLGRKQFDDAERGARAALAATEQAGPFEVSCEALEILGRLARRTDLATAEALFERAASIAASHDLPVWQVRSLQELATLDLLGSLRLDRMEQARDLALHLGALAVAATADHHRTAACTMRGEFDIGLRIAEQAIRTAQRLHLPSVPATLLFQAGLRMMRGETATAEELITQALAFGPDDPRLASDAWGVRGIRWLLAEDKQRALDALDRSMKFIRQEREPTAPPLGQWLVLATLERGEQAAAELAAIPEVLVARWNIGQVGYAAAINAGRRGDQRGAELAFADADSAMTTPVPIPFYRHISRRLVAEAAIRDRWGDPVQWLTDDLIYFQSTGHQRVAAACRGLLRRAGARVSRHTPGPPVPEQLRLRGVTGREMDVLTLIGEGLVNRDIAARLFVSPRTVEKHIENLLAKTGLSTRSALVARAARDNW